MQPITRDSLITIQEAISMIPKYDMDRMQEVIEENAIKAYTRTPSHASSLPHSGHHYRDSKAEIFDVKIKIDDCFVVPLAKYCQLKTPLMWCDGAVICKTISVVDIAGNQPILDERYGRGVIIVAEGICHNGGQWWSFSPDKILLLEDEVQRLKGKADKKKDRQTVYADKELRDLIFAAKPEVVKIFEEIKKGGWCSKDVIKNKKAIALKFYEANKWAYVKKQYL
jgi:hypothetical protein